MTGTGDTIESVPVNGNSLTDARLRWRFVFERERQRDVLVVSLHGRIGYSTAAPFADLLAEAVAQGEPRVIVDLAGVDYVSSPGVLALFTLGRRMAATDGALMLCGLSEPVRRVFELAGLSQHVVIEPTLGDALERMGSRQCAEGS